MLEVDYDASGIPRVEFGDKNLQRLLLLKQKQDKNYKLNKTNSGDSVTFKLDASNNDQIFAAKIDITNVSTFNSQNFTFTIEQHTYTYSYPGLGNLSDYVPTPPETMYDDFGIYNTSQTRFVPDKVQISDKNIDTFIFYDSTLKVLQFVFMNKDIIEDIDVLLKIDGSGSIHTVNNSTSQLIAYEEDNFEDPIQKGNTILIPLNHTFRISQNGEYVALWNLYNYFEDSGSNKVYYNVSTRFKNTLSSGWDSNVYVDSYTFPYVQDKFTFKFIHPMIFDQSQNVIVDSVREMQNFGATTRYRYFDNDPYLYYNDIDFSITKHENAPVVTYTLKYGVYDENAAYISTCNFYIDGNPKMAIKDNALEILEGFNMYPNDFYMISIPDIKDVVDRENGTNGTKLIYRTPSSKDHVIELSHSPFGDTLQQYNIELYELTNLNSVITTLNGSPDFTFNLEKGILYETNMIPPSIQYSTKYLLLKSSSNNHIIYNSSIRYDYLPYINNFKFFSMHNTLLTENSMTIGPLTVDESDIALPMDATGMQRFSINKNSILNVSINPVGYFTLHNAQGENIQEVILDKMFSSAAEFKALYESIVIKVNPKNVKFDDDPIRITFTFTEPEFNFTYDLIVLVHLNYRASIVDLPDLSYTFELNTISSIQPFQETYLQKIYEVVVRYEKDSNIIYPFRIRLKKSIMMSNSTTKISIMALQFLKQDYTFIMMGKYLPRLHILITARNMLS